jgi:hypothetical protein
LKKEEVSWLSQSNSFLQEFLIFLGLCPKLDYYPLILVFHAFKYS